MSTKEKGEEIANAWGPALTKAMLEGDMTPFKELCVKGEPVDMVLQGSDGVEIETSIGDSGADLTWEKFQELCSKDLEAQNFQKIEAQCLGVLGDRMILETGRFNKAGEVYMESYAIVTINSDGKVVMFEAFVDPQMASLTAEVSKK